MARSIENVQDAESKAAKMVEDAEKAKAEKIAKAKDKAAAMISDAGERAKTVKAEAVSQAGDEIARSRERGLAEAKNLAKKIEGMKVSKERLRRAVGKAVKEIVG